ncbi:MAG: OmpA family protein [Acidimicrobiales bacterium]
MAEPSDDIDRKTTAPEGRPARGGPSLAEDQPDELPALLAIAVGIAVIAVLLVPMGTSALTTTSETAVVVSESADGETTVELIELDLVEMNGLLIDAGFTDIAITADGSTVTARGGVAGEDERAAVIAALAGMEGVEEVIDELQIDGETGTGTAATEPSTVSAQADQTSIILEGVVPTQDTADAIEAAAVSLYPTEGQVDNQLTVDAAVATPVTMTVVGSLTDQALYNGLSAGFGGITGVEVDTSGLTLEASSTLETELNSLAPIEFASGSAQILPASEPVVDQAAAFLTQNPDAVVEVGGHTDSVGDEAANQTLSQARADAVTAALVARGVTNELQPQGYGESRPVENPDDTPEKQQANRRIEFRVISD